MQGNDIDRSFYETAFQIQNACNISGVAHELCHALRAMSDAGMGNSSRNAHPVTRLLLSKLCELAQYSHFEDSWEVFQAVKSRLERSKNDD